MNAIVVLVVLLLAACSGAAEPDAAGAGPTEPDAMPAAGEPELTAEGRAALRELETVELFSDDAIGVAGITPTWVESFRRLLGERDARTAFARLLETGSRAGRVYALCGLWCLGDPAFPGALARMEAEGGELRTQSGCIVADRPLAEVLRSPVAAAIRLRGPEDSLAAWRARNPGATGPLDVAAGGWPAVLRGD